MKRIFALLVAAALVCGISVARDRYTTDTSVLPAAARTMIENNFGKNKIHHIKCDHSITGSVSEYEVVLKDGTEIDFDSKGTWREVECGTKAVPQTLILKPIADYVRKNFNNSKIVKIAVERNKYDIELANGTELEFDRAGNFMRIDD